MIVLSNFTYIFKLYEDCSFLFKYLFINQVLIFVEVLEITQQITVCFKYIRLA